MILALGAELKKQNGVVLCVDRPCFPVPDIVTHPGSVIRYLWTRQALSEAGDNVFIFRPWAPAHYLLSNGGRILRSVNRIILGRQVRRVLNRFSHETRVSWIFHPFQSQCLGLAEENLSVYEAYDDYAAQAGAKRARRIKAAEDRLLNQVNVVLTTSQALFRNKRDKGYFTSCCWIRGSGHSRAYGHGNN
jgi:hypothetical protein